MKKDIFYNFLLSKSESDQNYIKEILKKSIIEKEDSVIFCINSKDESFFTDEILKVIKNATIKNVSLDIIKKSINETPFISSNFKIKDKNTDKFRVAVQTFWWTWISGVWHLDFNHFASREMSKDMFTTEELAGLIRDAMEETPFAIALIPPCVTLVIEGKIFKDNDKGNDVYIGFLYEIMNLGWWGRCTKNWN